MSQTKLSAQFLVLAWKFSVIDSLTFLQTAVNGGTEYFSLVEAELFSTTSGGLRPIKAIFFPLDGFKTATEYVFSPPKPNVVRIRAIQIAGYLGGYRVTIARPSAEANSA